MIKLVAYVLIAVSLTLGAISSTTAYLPRIDDAVGLTLNADAGVKTVTDADGRETKAPVLSELDDAGEDIVLTQEQIDTLKVAGVERVRVKEFGFGRWTGRWPFVASVAGLLVGAGVVRARNRAEVAEALGATRSEQDTPEFALTETRRVVDELLTTLAGMPSDADRNHAILDRVGELQQTHLPAFVGARAELIGRLGISGYAALMDRFAISERALNRAWSAAADNVFVEAEACLVRAGTLIDETVAKLG